MRLLSWNIYNNMSLPSIQMFLPKQNEAQHSAPSNLAVKRKRASTAELHADIEQSRDRVTILNQPASVEAAWSDAQPQWSAKVTAPHYPAQGLPTPLLSPTDSKMDIVQLPLSQVKSENRESSEARLRHSRQVIQQQINLEILLKHNELRLIDQELAKCQTALEQLRRCEEIPFPVSEPNLSVSTGRGSAVRSSFLSRLPESPPAWGVTDGPYTRHYSQWLLPDSRFDGGDPEPSTVISSKRPIKVRSLGSSYANEPVVGMSSRSQRGGNLKALPAGYSQPKEKAQGPLVLKRKSDGIMVKLICPVCSRGDFGSAQGFINHCRIGHGRNFSSHDQAAEQCGQPVTLDEHGTIMGQELTATSTTNSVHPLIRTARLQHAPSSPPPTARLLGLDGAMESNEETQLSISPDFRASFQTPHLSNLIQSKGLGFDLQGMVDEAKVKVEFPEPDNEQIEEIDGVSSAYESTDSHPLVAGTRGITRPVKSPLTSPVLHSRVMVSSNIGLETMGISGVGIIDTPVDPEPSPSTESNQAPSLIDDDEEYEIHSPESSSASDIADDGEVDFTVRDDDDFHGHVDLAKPEPQSSCAQTTVPQSPRPARMRRPSALRSLDSKNEAKHVTFVSENPGTPRTGGDAKRRKISKK
ncbi:hypothetical protein DV736_g4369, partial [Chaetothyriales sp. CBS 134916]